MSELGEIILLILFSIWVALGFTVYLFQADGKRQLRDDKVIKVIFLIFIGPIAWFSILAGKTFNVIENYFLE